MRTTVTILFLLLLAFAVAAEEEPRIRFSGLVQVDEDDLLDAAAEDLEDLLALLSRRSSADDLLPVAEDAAFEMTLHLRREGFAAAEVDPVPDAAKGEVEFLVSEGPQVLLGEVELLGEFEASREVLRTYVKPPKTWLFGDELYVVSNLETAALQMRGYLRQRGCLDAAVTFRPDPGLRSAAGSAEIRGRASFTIEEGPLYRLAAIRIEGGENVTRGHGVAEEHQGRPYTPFTPFELQSRASEICANEGYPFAEIAIGEEMLPNGGFVDVTVTLTIRQGPKSRFRAFVVTGNRRTTEEAIRREIEIDTGDDFDPARLVEAQKWLTKTGLYRQVFFDANPPDREGFMDEKGPVDVDVRLLVEEAPFRKVETYVGWGSWELLRGGVSASWLNLDGAGRALTLIAQGSLRGYLFGANVEEPWLFPRVLWDRTAGRASASIEDQVRPTYSFRREAMSFGIFKKDLFSRTDLNLAYTYNRTDVFEVNDDVPEEFENLTNIGAIGLTLFRETRDSSWAPTKGSALAARFDYADQDHLGGDLSFLRGRLTATHLFDVAPGFILVGRLSCGAISPFGKTDEIPIQERMYLGGGQTVRSFDEDDLGPRLINEDGTESSAASGGEFFSLVNLELRATVLGDLEGAVFIDGGNVIRKIHDAGIEDYRFAIGAGVRYRTPIGPLRLDFGWNPSPRDYEKTWRISFAVGYPF